MLVWLLEGLALIFVINKLLARSWRPMARRALFGVALWSIFFLLLAQLELAYTSPDGTYGSDARTYYKAMLLTLETGNWWPPEGIFSPGYVAFGALVLRTSLGDSVVWVKLANIGLLLGSLVLGFYILQSWNISKRIAYFVMVLAGTNGIVIWMAVRNLKDTLFLFLTLTLIAGTKLLLSKERHIPVFFRIAGILMLGFIGAQMLQSIRAWGEYWALILIGATIVESIFERGLPLRFKISKSWLFTTLPVGAALIAWLATSYQTIIQDFLIAFTYAERAGGLVRVDVSFIDIPIAIFRFLIGPGPIRAIFGHEVFLVTTTVGNILITLGAIMWWLYLPILALALLKGPHYWLRYSSVIIPLIVFLGVYSFAYSGSVETRFRAIIYFLAFLGTAPYLTDVVLQHRKVKWFLLYAGISAIIWVSGIVFSYYSLVGK